QACGHRRDLPSVPTRRSSDLVHVGEQTSSTTGVGCWMAPVSYLPPEQSGGGREEGCGRRPAQYVAGMFGMRGAGAEGTARTLAQDRKSTRLNSSHVKISYAVF